MHLCATRVHPCAVGVYLCGPGVRQCALGVYLCALGVRSLIESGTSFQKALELLKAPGRHIGLETVGYGLSRTSGFGFQDIVPGRPPSPPPPSSPFVRGSQSFKMMAPRV